jgi:uncharacterized RDD family membrane protein YckC
MPSLMTDDNPYAPPNAVDLIVLDDQLASVELADRSTRVVAWFIDQLLVTIFVFAIFLAYWGEIRVYLDRGENPLRVLAVGMLVFYFLSFLLIHGYFLKKTGQTIGKKLHSIRVSDLRGHVPDFTKLIFVRYALFAFFTVLWPVAILWLVNILFIFRGDRRCLHDLLAGTQVIKVTQPK